MSMIQILDTIRGMKPNDDYKALLAQEFPEVEVPAKQYQREYTYKYLVQGKALGLEGAELIAYAKAGVAKLFATMPHLAFAEVPVTEKVRMGAKVKSGRPQRTAEKVVAQRPKVEKKAAKAPAAPKTPKAIKIKHPNFAITFREDRNGFEGWYNGKAEAFRDTKEKVEKFFAKKYANEYKPS